MVGVDEAYRLLGVGLHPNAVALHSGLMTKELRKRFLYVHGASAGPFPKREDVRRRCSWEIGVFLRDYLRLAGAEEIDLTAVEEVHGSVSAAGGRHTLTDAWVLARDFRSGVIEADGRESTEVRLKELVRFQNMMHPPAARSQ